MISSFLLPLSIAVPAFAALLCWLLGKRFPRLMGILFLTAMTANAVIIAVIYKQPLMYEIPLGGFDLSIIFRVDALSSFVLVAAAILGLLIAVYSVTFMRGKKEVGLFFASFLWMMATTNGAVLADHLMTLLFFWEGMLAALFVMIYLGKTKSYPTAAKAFFINGVTDLCMMGGIGLVLLEANTLIISRISLPVEGLSGLAFALMAVGAVSKAGSLPFHSWIPDAAIDAPTPFMALIPGALEKLLGIYLLARISLDMFSIGQGWASTLLMVTGAVTIVLAGAMILIQKDYKRLLAFCAISQVGYMVLGIGTGTIVGIVGGLFHMINHAMYKSSLFLTAGSVERQAGTTDLSKIGGLASRMPITFACFLVGALSVAGVYPFNGFFSKELIYDAAWERGWPFYLAAIIGSFLTAASFLKLGHSAFKGSYQSPAEEVREAPWSMLVPMIIISAVCLVFGVLNFLPIHELVVPAVMPALSEQALAEVHLSGLIPVAWGLAAITVLVQLAAVGNHYWGFYRTGTGRALNAVDHIRYAPVVNQLYNAAEKRWFDPYEWAILFLRGFAQLMNFFDQAIDFVYDQVLPKATRTGARLLSYAHSGSHTVYLAWSIMGVALLVFYFITEL